MKKIIDKIVWFCKKFKYGTVMFLVGAVVLYWDMLSKAISEGQNVSVIKGVFSFFSSHNTGAAWSVLNQHTWLLILISIIFLGVILFANGLYKKKNFFYAISLGLILSGAIGNLIDRICFGYVRDFISLDFINFPIFNLADCAICVGVVMLCIYLIFLSPKDEVSEDIKLEQNEETKTEIATVDGLVEEKKINTKTNTQTQNNKADK